MRYCPEIFLERKENHEISHLRLTVFVSRFATGRPEYEIKFLPTGITHSLIHLFIYFIFKYNQQYATLHNVFIYVKMLYMFRAGPPPIIRSSKLYTQHRVLARLYCYLSLS
jgi:hypothetical protein